MSDTSYSHAKSAYAEIERMISALGLDWGRLEELREKAQLKFVAGWNMPGYMPDNEACDFESSEAALDYIKAEATRDLDLEADNAEALQEIDSWKSDAQGEFGCTFGNYHYWITKGDPLDSDERAELHEMGAVAGEWTCPDDVGDDLADHPLEGLMRSGWASSADGFQPAEFLILTSTGIRVCGELDEHGSATRAYLQHQDWDEPWQDYLAGDGDVLLRYAQRFFGG